MAKKMKSKSLESDRVDAFVEEVRRNPGFEVLPTTNEYELLRARTDGHVLVVYTSGKVSYHDTEAIESLLSKYGASEKAPKGPRRRDDLKSINVKLQEKQKEFLIRELSMIAESVDTPGDYEQAAFKIDSAKITVYATGTVYSPHGHPEFEKAIVAAIRQYPSHPEYDIVIGQDEVGKGEVFGPMIVGSVAVTQDEAIALQFAGIRDSKDLNEQQIAGLAEAVKKGSIARRTVAIGTRRFNKRFEEFKQEDQTLNDLLAWAHAKALDEVLYQLQKARDDEPRILVIIDEFGRVSTDKRLSNVIKKANITVLQTAHAEDLSASVAAASILARAHRDSDMKELAEAIGVPLDRRNLSTILAHPKGHDAVKLAYLNGAREPTISRSTLEGQAADAILGRILANAHLETHDNDFKRNMSEHKDNIGKLVAAMANCDGGTIFFGIKQDSSRKELDIVGLEAPQKVEESVSGQVKLCDPSPLVDFVELISKDGHSVLSVKVPMSRKIVRFKGKYYKRVGSTTEEMTSYDIENWPSSCRRSQ